MNPPSQASKTARLRKRLQSLSMEINQLSPDEYTQIADEFMQIIRPNPTVDELHDLAPFPEENPNPVLRVSNEGILLYCNQAARFLLGGDCCIDQPAPTFFQDLARSIRHGGERQMVNFDYQGRIFSLDIVPIAKYGYINVYGRDVTLHIQARDAREQLLAENQHQQALLEAITDANPGGIAVLLGPELVIAHANPAYRFISPHDGKDPVGRPYQEVWSVEARDCYAGELLEVLETGRPFQVIGFERHFADGTTRIFTLQARRIYWTDKPAVLLILWDTTEVVNAERKLLDTQERMRMALANSSVSMFTLDRDLRYTWLYNPRYGFTGDQTLGKRLDELIPTHEMAEIVAWKRQVLESGKADRREVHYQMGNQTVYSDISLEPLKDVKGNIIGLLGSSIDLTEKKQAETALQRSKQQILNIFDSITDCCYTLDPEWCFTIINDQALDYFQKSREELMGRSFWETFPQALATLVESNYRKAVREQVPVHYEVLSPLTGRWVEVHAYPSVEGLFVILRDVTTRRQFQEIHQAMNEVQQVLHSTLDVDEVMQRALTTAAQALGSDTAVLSMRMHQGWFVKYVHGFPSDVIGLQMDDQQERHGVLAIQTKKPVAISDTEKDKRVNHEHLRKWGIRSVLVVPVLLREEAIGALFFNYSKAPCEFSQVHIDFATQLAGSISLALENARLYQNLQRELEERKHVEIEREKLTGEIFAQNRLLEQMIRDAPVGIAIVSSLEPRYELVNEYYRQATSSKGELIGRTVAEVWPDGADELLKLLDQVCRTGEIFRTVDAPFTTKQGQEFVNRFFTFTLLPLKNQAGVVERIMVLVMDTTQQVMARQVIEASEARLKAIIENAPLGIVVTDEKARILLTNSVGERISGRPIPYKQEYSSHEVLQFCYPDGTPYLPRDLPLTRSALDGDISKNVEISIQGPGAEQRPILVNTAPIRDTEGKITGAVGIFQDITEIKQAEQALRESQRELAADLANTTKLQQISTQLIHANRTEDLYQGLVQAAMALMRSEMGSIHVLDLERNSLKLVAWSGFAPESAKFWEWMPADSASFCGVAWQKGGRLIVPDVETWDLVIGMEDLDYYRLSGIRAMQSTPLVSRSGQVMGIISTHWREVHQPSERELRLFDVLVRLAADLIERQQVQVSLDTIQERLLLITEAAGVGGWSIDVETMQVYCDDQVRQLLALPAEIPLDVDFYQQLVDPEDWAHVEQVAHRMLTVPDHLEVEFRMRDTEGRQRWLYARGQGKFDFHGRPHQLVGVVMDISERKRVHEDVLAGLARIEAQQYLLEQRELERLKIARDLHDGPMQEILGAIYTLEGMIAIENDSDLMNGLKAVLATLHNQLAEMRSYASELRPPTLTNFGIEKAILSHLETWRRRYPDIHVKYVYDHSDRKLPEALRLPLFRIYQEALNNITRHAGATQVVIHLDKNASGEVRLTIRDNGSGFDLPKDWMSLARQGHLGLVGMRERVQAIGGRLEIQSQAGKGTRIQVTVPLEGNAKKSQL